MRAIGFAAAIVALLAVGGGCATTVPGVYDYVRVTTDPPDAEIQYDYVYYASGDWVKVRSSTFGDVVIEVQRKGYKSKAVTVDQKIDIGWGIVGNVICTLGLGILYDASTGALMDPAESEISVTLEKDE